MQIIKMALSFFLIAAFGVYFWNRVGVEDKDHAFYCYYISSLMLIGYLTIKWVSAEQKLRRILGQAESDEEN